MQPTSSTSGRTTPPSIEKEAGSAKGKTAGSSALGDAVQRLSNSNENPISRGSAILVLGENLKEIEIIKLICENTPQMNSNKSTYKYVFLHETTQKAAITTSQEILNDNKGKDKLNTSTYLHLSNTDLNEFKKIYLHADSVSGGIRSGQSSFTAESLANTLVENDVLTKIKDIRLLSGESKNSDISFYETLKREFEKKNLLDISVTGYKGEPIFEEESIHHRRSVNNITTRRSAVKIKFSAIKND